VLLAPAWVAVYFHVLPLTSLGIRTLSIRPVIANFVALGIYLGLVLADIPVALTLHFLHFSVDGRVMSRRSVRLAIAIVGGRGGQPYGRRIWASIIATRH
jgi:hypothetical protein